MSAATMRTALAAILALGACTGALAAPQVLPSPTVPKYGEPVQVELRDATWPPYLPATRYSRSGSSIVIEYEYMSDAFTFSPAFSSSPLNLGELPPGNYTVTARLYDTTTSTKTDVRGAIAVLPPEEWGIYAVPRDPPPFLPVDILVRSAAFFDPASMKYTVVGNVIRVDFTYDPGAPVGGPVPRGMTSFASIQVPGLQPGAYRLEGWGRATTGGEPQRYFTHDIAVNPAASVVEYYSDALDHYFVTASPEEVRQLDSGAQPGWKRTGLGFKAWLHASEAPLNARPVCRFYTRDGNSHFYTGDPNECSFLKSLEQQQRAVASSKGESFGGWQYEGIAFYALLPQSGQCPGSTVPVQRAYNNRASQHDPNHRFTSDATMNYAMEGWVREGVAFCSPQ